LGLRLAPDMSVPHPSVRMATMVTIPMRAHHTDTTVLRGSSVVSSSAPARGITALVSIDRTFMLADGTAPALTRILAMATIIAADTLIVARLRARKSAAASALLVVSTACVGNYLEIPDLDDWYGAVQLLDGPAAVLSLARKHRASPRTSPATLPLTWVLS
jgi:hypothetical protein